MIKVALAIVVVFAAAQQLAQADKGRAAALQRRAVVLGGDLRREASCETWASAYAEQPSDERGFRAAHCVARVGEYCRGVSIDGLAHGVEGSAAGVQISGFGNFWDRAWGLALAGGGNVSREFGGAMVSGVWNRGDISSLQIAMLNQAHVRFAGLQLGLINANNLRLVGARR